MSTSDKFRTHAEMLSGSEFIQYLERLIAGNATTLTGYNRPLGRLAFGTDALLDAIQSTRNQIVTFAGAGTGKLDWDGSTFTVTGNLFIRMLNEVAGARTNKIATGSSIALADGEVAYVTLDRTTTAAAVTMTLAANWTAFDALASSSNRLDLQVIAYCEGSNLILWDGRRIRDGEYLDDDGFRDTQYSRRSWQNWQMKTYLAGNAPAGGEPRNVKWTASTATISVDSDIFVDIPGVGYNKLVATAYPWSIALADGKAAYLVLDRANGTKSTDVDVTPVSTANLAAVPEGEDTIILAIRRGDNIALWDGTILGPAESATTKAQFHYEGGPVRVLKDNAGTSILTGHVAIKEDLGLTAIFDENVGSVTFKNTGIRTLKNTADGGADITDTDVEIIQGAGFDLTWDAGTPDLTLGVQAGFTDMGDDIWENNRISITDGGTLDWDSTAETLTWAADLKIFSPGRFANKLTAATSAAIGVNQALYITLNRNLSATPVVGAAVRDGTLAVGDIDASGASPVPDGEDVFILATRGNTNKLFLWDGTQLQDGESVTLGETVRNLSNLNNVGTSTEDAVVATEALATPPSTSNRILLVSDLADLIQPTMGFSYVRCTSTTAVKVGAGSVFIDGSIYRTSSETSLADTDVDLDNVSGDFTAYTGIAYVYAGESGTYDTAPTIGLSRTAPNGRGKATLNSNNYQSVGSVHVISGNFQRAVRSGDQVMLLATAGISADLTADIDSAVLTPANKVDFSDSSKSYFLPASAVAVRILLTVNLLQSTGTADEPRISYEPWTGATGTPPTGGSAVGDQTTFYLPARADTSVGDPDPPVSVEMTIPLTGAQQVGFPSNFLNASTAVHEAVLLGYIDQIRAA
jgi:hypothetical protein